MPASYNPDGRKWLDHGLAEFLATRDSWFRPVFAATGPDGALYVVTDETNGELWKITPTRSRR